jgi:hypothetical protein
MSFSALSLEDARVYLRAVEFFGTLSESIRVSWCIVARLLHFRIHPGPIDGVSGNLSLRCTCAGSHGDSQRIVDELALIRSQFLSDHSCVRKLHVKTGFLASGSEIHRASVARAH